MKRTILVASALLLGVSACSEAPNALEPSATANFARPSTNPNASADQWLKAVRQATARYNSQELAERDGYAPDTFCVAHPVLGGMGYHWANIGLIDPVFDAQQPEVLLYGTAPNGKLRLIGVEYVVINVGQPKPAFAGHQFDEGGVPPLEAEGVPHWSLHYWLYEHNESGAHAPFNPAVTCP